MRVLLVHNLYGSTAPSGENQVFEAEKTMLERHGVEVEAFTRHSDEIRLFDCSDCLIVRLLKRMWGLVKGALCTVANPSAARALGRKIQEFKPDVVHFHNTFPLISPLAIRTAKKCGVKVVMTLHNYRMVCAAGVPMRDGKICDACFRKVKVKGEGERRTLTVISALRNRCYRGSMLATVPLALNIWLYRKCWAKWVDRFIVLSEFQRQIMIECGLAAEKIVVKGNFIQSNNLNNPNNRTMRSGFVFVGRLSDEKGLRTLIAAWRLLGAEAPNLTVIGDGDSRVTYETLATGLNIKYVGKKSHEEVMDVFSRARFIIQPSLCWETFGLTIVEAAACGAPAIVSDVGTLPELVKDGVSGVVFKVGDAEDLARVVREMRNTHDWGEMSSAARTESKRYSESNNYSVLMDLYLSLKEPEGRGC